MGFSFDFDASSLGFSVGTPIRRREDTERDRDSGVKVQIAGEEESGFLNASRNVKQIERKFKKSTLTSG